MPDPKDHGASEAYKRMAEQFPTSPYPTMQRDKPDQAAEIEKLETERDDWQKVAQDQIDRNAHQQATLMVMRTALVSADKAINPEDRGGISLAEWNERLKMATENIRQALATDTGKAAADVLAQAEEVEEFHRIHNDPSRTMSDADWRKGMDECIVKLRGFVEAYRKEGRGDG